MSQVRDEWQWIGAEGAGPRLDMLRAEARDKVK